MGNILNDVPDPENAPDDPSGFLRQSFVFMVTAGVMIGLWRAGRAVIGGPVGNVVSSLANSASTTAQETTGSIGDGEVF